jgi:hypothetical protein
MWLDASRGTGNDDEVVRPSISYQSVIWGTLEHDIHHGSEVSTTLGVHGLPVLDLD